MSAAANKFEFLAAQMADHEANWSLGTFGAIAEFMRGADEPVTLSRSGAAVAAVTARGGIRIEAREDVRAQRRALAFDDRAQTFLLDLREALPVRLEDADQLRPEEGEVLHLVEDGQDHCELEQVTRGRRHGTIHRQEPRST